MVSVKTITEIRRDNLLRLIEQHGGGSVANLNEKVGLDRSDATLTQIKNQNVNSGTGKPRGMGDALARRIEAALGLPTGYMDNVLMYDNPQMAERMEALHKLAEALGPYQVDQLIKIGAALVEPKKNGTEG
jgi:hypothetical protein